MSLFKKLKFVHSWLKLLFGMDSNLEFSPDASGWNLKFSALVFGIWNLAPMLRGRTCTLEFGISL
jgi:hypothetical protein